MTIQWSYRIRHLIGGIYAFDLSRGTKIKIRVAFQQLDGDLGNRSFACPDFLQHGFASPRLFSPGARTHATNQARLRRSMPLQVPTKSKKKDTVLYLRVTESVVR
jgi:hypothetical protein